MNRSFTVKCKDGLLTALATPCHVSQAFNPTNGSREYPRIEFDALWDTGSTKSVITQRVVQACGLKPIRKGFTQGVNGIGKSHAYVINLSLPDKITFYELTVVSTNPGNVWWDVLIGMDIISTGELSIKNVNSNTEWSFSYGPQQKIDATSMRPAKGGGVQISVS
ncbi:retropepsin-like aspartic protease [Nitrosospira multiformis]|uniref:retropepsin-like aspartic protease n=1 Tax=Nitrosospira multiformis TaxID=1231 RepID=UPI000899CD61|nr:retropepsin-like aspartic protease [Nitrosospira multiformis]SDZ82655.1 gag-polyprotein putative aspartyl protease [Nitrosospira multiformis]